MQDLSTGPAKTLAGEYYCAAGIYAAATEKIFAWVWLYAPGAYCEQ